jgi:hypothetical protein
MSRDRRAKIKKLSGVTSTQPLYETLDGKEFTIADIVQGKIKPPKKYKAKSLSYRYRANKKKASRAAGIAKSAYSSGNEKTIEPVRNMPSIDIPGPPDPYFGLVPNDFTNLGGEENMETHFLGLENKIDDSEGKGFDLTSYLIDLSNALDKNKKKDASDFIDYLIIKSAEDNNIDYSNAFNDLIIKINESDIDMKNSFIKKMATKFSRLINISMSNGSSVYDAKKMSYQKCLLLVESKMVE